MDKDFKFNIGYFTMDGSDFLNRQFASQHDTTKAQVAQPAHFLCRSVIRLGGGMKLHIPQPWFLISQLQQCHILNQDGIGTSILQVEKKTTSSLQFMIVENGVDRDINSHTVSMRILAKLADVVSTVAYGSTSTKLTGTNIDGIGAMVDSSHAALQVLGRCQQF